MKKIHSITGAVSLLFLLSACGSVYVEEDPAVGLVDEEPVPALPPYSGGSKVTVAVLPLGLTERTARMYPKLQEELAGMGIDGRINDALFDTNRFRFVEAREDVLKDITNRQWMSETDFTTESAIKYGRMLGARRVIYGEVFEYARGGEDIRAFRNRQGFRTVVGVQIAYTDVETGEKLSLGTGRAFGATLIEATEKAVRKAVYRLIERLEDRHAKQ